MAKKPTFILRRRGGKSEEVAFTPVMVIVGTTAHRLALHKDTVGDWVVSHPESGAAVIRRLTGWYKGIPVSMGKITLKQARELALFEVEALAQRIGSAKFNAALANPKPF
jgi:hypothetical protein